MQIVSCSMTQHTDAGFQTVNVCIQKPTFKLQDQYAPNRKFCSRIVIVLELEDIYLIPSIIYIYASDGTIPKLLPIPIQFRFYCKISNSDSNYDPCKHSMSANIGIGITMFNVVIPYYLPALVLEKITL